MKAPIKWLKDYVDIRCSAEEYAGKMVMAGTGVEEIIDLGAQFSGVVVGRVLTCVDHPDSDHLHVCTVDVGQGEPLQIVCGAPNVCAGALVPVALVGAELSGIKIKKGKIRGVESCGMLCSGSELGVPDGLYPNCGEAGLLLFQEDHPLGQDVKQIFGLDEQVVDFEILANRPDCLSIWGLARESAAVLDEHCLMPEIAVVETGAGTLEDYAKIEVRDAEKCPRYCARVIDDVKIGPSPAWMRQYLFAAGVRPINNIVDITNFVMLETGHPMHAFDLSRVKGQDEAERSECWKGEDSPNGLRIPETLGAQANSAKSIIVRCANEGEQLTTLDGKQHQLTADMLVIADASSATGLAGIMGGEESEITEDTRAVLFECAAFDRTSSRLTSRALGIRTESSGRFERGVCVENTMQALERACMLVNMLECGSVVPGSFDYYPNPVPERTVDASVSRINSRISTDLSGDEMEDILLRLGIDVALSGDQLSCTIPEWRGDITQEADLSEEVLRLYGYEHIPSTLPVGETMAGLRSQELQMQERIKQALVGQGFYEAMNFSFVSMKWLESLDLPQGDWRLDPVVVRNPLGEDTACMRTTLVPSMLNSLSTNLNRSNPEARLFELSSVFQKTRPGELPNEPRVLTLGMYGQHTDFYSLKDAVWCLLQVFGIEPEAARGGDPYLHPGRKAEILSGGVRIGQMGEAHPDAAQRFSIEGKRIYIAEIMLDAIAACAVPVGSVVPLPRFPSVSRDLALVMDEGVGVGPLMAGIKAAAGKLIEDVQLFDIYRGAQLGEGKKSVAFALTFRACDRTLTEEEIGKAMDRVLRACQEQFAAEIRK